MLVKSAKNGIVIDLSNAMINNGEVLYFNDKPVKPKKNANNTKKSKK
jgi:hypothetical protein